MNNKANLEEFRSLLDQFGVADDLEWLACVLFVRNLVAHLDLFDKEIKKSVQESVLTEISKQDLSPEAFQTVIRHIEAFIVDNNINRDLTQALNRERKDTYSLFEEMTALFTAIRGSRTKQEESLTRFGEKSVQAVEAATSKAGIVSQLRGMLTELVSEFKEEARSWEERAKVLEHNAQHDPLLTELFNRRSLDAHLGDAVVKAQSRNTPLSLLMIDVDDFKQVNDTYGHQAGDELLRALAKVIITHAMLVEGYAARYGGEELTVICPMDLGPTVKIAEFIRRDVEKYEFYTRTNGQLSDTINFTVSIGVAQLEKGWSGERLISAADAALYTAKRSGKNMVVSNDQGQ